MAESVSEPTRETVERCFDDIAGANGFAELAFVGRALAKMGLPPLSDHELFAATEGSDETGLGEISLATFTLLVATCRRRQDAANAGDDTTAASFVSVGGRPDRTGSVSVEKLRRLFHELRIPISIGALLNSYDTDKSGYLEYDEFSAMLSDDTRT
ncbi:Dynein 18 kDa light chain [Diplonema papillatum]|nr:Dynein 18 kDa light chain [Diplonema papillatum]